MPRPALISGPSGRSSDLTRISAALRPPSSRLSPARKWPPTLPVILPFGEGLAGVVFAASRSGCAAGVLAPAAPLTIGQEVPVRLLRLRLARLAVSVCVMTLIASASTAFASGYTCTFGSSNGNVETCLTVDNTGLYVDHMTPSATVFNSGRTLGLTLFDPFGVDLEFAPFVFVPAGQTLKFTWSPKSRLTPGKYCAVTQRLNSDNTYTVIGNACFSLHS